MTLGAIVSLLALVAALQQFHWLPAAPSIEPKGAPSETAPFLFPFTISNKSKIFPIKVVEVHCSIDYAEFERGRLGLIDTELEKFYLSVERAKTIRCPIQWLIEDAHTQRLIRAFITVYIETNLPWPWNSTWESFEWDGISKQWLKR